jgi:cytochrome P450
MEDSMLHHIRLFTANLVSLETTESNPSEWSSAKNISQYSGWLTFDVMGELCFGKAFHMLEDEANRFATKLVATASKRHYICGSYLPIHEYSLDKLLFRNIAEGRAKFMSYVRNQMKDRSEKGLEVEKKDFFYYLLKARDPETGEGFSPTELWGEAHLLMIAGSDTTSTAISSTLFYLVHNPTILEHVQKEVRSSFADLESIRSGPVLNSLTYLRACIDESMRMSPSNGGLLPRTVLSGGITIDNHLIPEGMTVNVPPYTIHHNASYYPDPFRYDPSRWLPPNHPLSTGYSAEQVAMVHSAFCPFSVGPRGCIGKGMAYMEMTIALARIMWLYDMRLAPGTNVGEGGYPGAPYGRHRKEEFQLEDIFVSEKDGPMVQFRLRPHNADEKVNL